MRVKRKWVIRRQSTVQYDKQRRHMQATQSRRTARFLVFYRVLWFNVKWAQHKPSRSRRKACLKRRMWPADQVDWFLRDTTTMWSSAFEVFKGIASFPCKSTYSVEEGLPSKLKPKTSRLKRANHAFKTAKHMAHDMTWLQPGLAWIILSISSTSLGSASIRSSRV